MPCNSSRASFYALELVYSIIDHSVITPTLKGTSIKFGVFFINFWVAKPQPLIGCTRKLSVTLPTLSRNTGGGGRVAKALDSSPGVSEFESRYRYYLNLEHSNTSFKSKATLSNLEV